MEIMDGKNLSNIIKDDLRKEISQYVQTPILAVITIGDDEASKVYVSNKRKSCEQVGFSFLHFDYLSEVEEQVVIDKIKELNKDKSINGIIVQLPIPDNFNERKIINTIDVSKDVDGLTDNSILRRMNNKDALIPCTTKGILELLDYYKIDLESKLNISNEDTIKMSIKNNIGLEELKTKIIEMFNLEKIETNDLTYLTDARSISLLKKSKKILENCLQNISTYPVDVIELDLKECWNILGEIIGQTYKDELIDEIFSRFCLGK